MTGTAAPPHYFVAARSHTVYTFGIEKFKRKFGNHTGKRARLLEGSVDHLFRKPRNLANGAASSSSTTRNDCLPFMAL